jgi:2-methylaconitate cis-trans-isomerase PrpF
MAASLEELPVVVMRGGTSKGVFCRLSALPPPGSPRDRFLLALLGSPDPMQLDGLGGTHSSTSKVVAVGAGREPGVDVEYLFAQVGVDRPVVDYAGNCGNLTAAVGPYAIDEGLVDRLDGPERVLVLANLNTGVRIRARVPLDGGRAAWVGDCAIDGVPGTGAPIVTDYLDPAGSVTGKLFPTGSRVDRIDGLDVSIVDVATPYTFVRSSDLGLAGDEVPAELNADAELLARLERLRAASGEAIGVASAAVPRLVLVSSPTIPEGAGAADVRVQVTSMQRVHHATPVTGALCTAAAANLAGTVAAAVAARSGSHVRIEHPKGLVEATVDIDGDQVRATGIVRTARRLLAGTAYVPLR